MGELDNDVPAHFEQLLQKHEQLTMQQTPKRELPTLPAQKPAPYGTMTPGSQRSGHENYDQQQAETKHHYEESDDDVQDIDDDEFDDDDIEQAILPDRQSREEVIMPHQASDRMQAVKEPTVL